MKFSGSKEELRWRLSDAPVVVELKEVAPSPSLEAICEDGPWSAGSIRRTTVTKIRLIAGLLAALTAWAESGQRAGESREFDGMEFVWAPSGEFPMGSTSAEARSNEQPVTQVRISRGYWLGKYEVTQGEWQSVMGSNPSRFSGCGNCPVEKVSWNDAQEFIGRLNQGSGGMRYRLPTEAEWEYAARAGTSGDRYSGDLDAIARYGEGLDGSTYPVGRKEPNAWGLHDMLGNVYEWVQDWYGGYPGGTVTDPRGPDSGSSRVFRGGSWFSPARNCRASYRYDFSPGARNFILGVRLLRTE